MTEDWTGNLAERPLARALRRLWRAWPLAVAVGVGAVLGGMLLMMGAQVPLAGIAGVALVWVAGSRAEAVLLLLLAFCCALIPTELNRSVSLLVVNVYVTDLLFLPLVAILLIRLLGRRGWRWRSTPLDVPVLLFLGATVAGMVNSALFHGASLADTTYEAHFLAYYVVYFLATNMVRRREQLVLLVKGALVIAVALALVMTAQAVGVDIPYMDANVLRADEGVTRLFHPGTNLLFVSLFVLVCYAVITRTRRRMPLLVVTGALLVTAVGMGLSRNTIVAGSAGMAVGAVILRRHHLGRLVGPATLVVAAIAAIAWLEVSGHSTFVGRYLTAYATRLNRMFSGDLFTDADTLNWRFREISYAWPLIEANPVLGIGLSVPYRPQFYLGDALTRYIHNAYLYLWLKTGLLGLVSFLWMSFRFLRRSLTLWNQVSDELLQALVVGGGLAFMSEVMGNMVAPSLVQDWGSVVYPLLLGGVECALLTSRSPALPYVRREVQL